MRVLKIISVGLFACLFSACFYDVEELLYPIDECNTMDISFSADVLPILESNCFGCHSSTARFGGVVVDNYNDILTPVDNGSLLGAINHSSGYSPMPKNAPKLLDCEINIISAWIQDGALNN